MGIPELKETLIEKDFKEEKRDTGLHYSKKINGIKLICYIEPEIEIQFCVIYSWNYNEVKGVYDISVKEFKLKEYTLESLFLGTLDYMPHYVGEVNISTIIRDTILETFGSNQ